MTRNQTATNLLILNGCNGQVQYQSEVTTAKLGDREIRLYNVFAKYANKSDKK